MSIVVMFFWWGVVADADFDTAEKLYTFYLRFFSSVLTDFVYSRNKLVMSSRKKEKIAVLYLHFCGFGKELRIKEEEKWNGI